MERRFRMMGYARSPGLYAGRRGIFLCADWRISYGRGCLISYSEVVPIVVMISLAFERVS
ncbi:MAG: hypothetical protein SPD11_07710 [Sphaerochaetaceae bacterium]|nr:hypothetical protein [Sphaerochaetaceae bacterium]